MKVFLASEFRCTIYQNEYYLAPKAYAIYKRYADAFGDIVLCSRFEHVNRLPKGYGKANFICKTIAIQNLADVFLYEYRSVMLKEMQNCDLVIGRLPSITGYRAFDCASKLNKKYFAECMGDAWDGCWNHDFIGKMIAPYMLLKMKLVVRNADYASYVTDRFLQKRYPCRKKSVNVSNVAIKNIDKAVLDVRKRKISGMNRKKISLMTSGGVNVRAKGHEFVIKAMKTLKEKGYEITYFLAGAGDQTRLRKIAEENNVTDNVVFLGELTMEDVYKYLDKTDIYIQPSLQEGLPRAVIEAMSRACPCLGTNTGGTPELLDVNCIFKRRSSSAIVKSIEWLLSQDVYSYAQRNFEHSKSYIDSILSQKRNDYFKYVRQDIEQNNGEALR